LPSGSLCSRTVAVLTIRPSESRILIPLVLGGAVSRFSWWVFAVIGLVAVAGGGIVVTQVPTLRIQGIGTALMALGVVAMAASVHVRGDSSVLS
jgi:predicted phage tail protein